MELTPLTELEAVNTMLDSISEEPVDTLVGSAGLSDVARALRMLRKESLVVQQAGWHFNSEDDYPLTRNTANELVVPPNVLKMDTDGLSRYDFDVTVRGTRLYDRKNHRFTFDRDVTVNIVFMLPFEDLPQYARNLVMCKAMKSFQNSALGSERIDKNIDTEIAFAEHAFMEAELVNGDSNFFSGSNDVLNGWIRGRDPYLIPLSS